MLVDHPGLVCHGKLTEGYGLALHELDCESGWRSYGMVSTLRIPVPRSANGTARSEVSGRKKAQQALGDDRQRTLRAVKQMLERQSARVSHLLAADITAPCRPQDDHSNPRT